MINGNLKKLFLKEVIQAERAYLAAEALPKLQYIICFPVDFDDGRYVFSFDGNHYEAMVINSNLNWVKKTYWELTARSRKFLIAEVAFRTTKGFKSLTPQDPYEFIRWIKGEKAS